MAPQPGSLHSPTQRRKRKGGGSPSPSPSSSPSLNGSPFPLTGTAHPPSSPLLYHRDDGTLAPTAVNGRLLVEGSPHWAGQIAYNLFAQRIQRRNSDGSWRDWEERDSHELEAWLVGEGMPGIFQPTLPLQIARHVAHRNTFDPLRAWADSLSWDGVRRIVHWAPRLLGTEPPGSPLPTSPPYLYSQLIPAKWLVAAMARIYQPGCKVDNVLVLEGEQGLRKSTALGVLGGPFYLETLPSVLSRSAMEVLSGAWLVEIDELDALDKATATRVNSFLSRREDRFRPAYAASAQSFPRRCIFAATTNQSDYLRDPTGARRFWPVHCTRIDLGGLAAVRDQLWAEAKEAYWLGKSWWLEGQGEASLARAAQADRALEDPWTSRILDSLDSHNLPYLAPTALYPILGLDPERTAPWADQRIAGVLRRAGWTPERKALAGSSRRAHRARVWRRPGAPSLPSPIPLASLAR